MNRLRPMESTDLALVLEWRNHPDIRQCMYSQEAIAAEDHQRWFERCRGDANVHLLVYEQAGQPCGFMNLRVVEQERCAVWGFYAAPGASRGSGTRMCAAAIDYAFDQLGLHKVWGEVIATNYKSIALHQRLGFQQESRFRDKHVKDEIFVDVFGYGLLRNEWRELRKEISDDTSN